ncbi:MAG: hypothetical protein ACLU99_05240 [Alphaproteobacteria bacterium]
MSENTETQLELFALPEISRPRETAPMQKNLNPFPVLTGPVSILSLSAVRKKSV